MIFIYFIQRLLAIFTITQALDTRTIEYEGANNIFNASDVVVDADLLVSGANNVFKGVRVKFYEDSNGTSVFLSREIYIEEEENGEPSNQSDIIRRFINLLGDDFVLEAYNSCDAEIRHTKDKPGSMSKIAAFIRRLVSKQWVECETYATYHEQMAWQIKTCTIKSRTGCDLISSKGAITAALEKVTTDPFYENSYRGTFSMDYGDSWRVCVQYFHSKHASSYPDCPIDWCSS